jgi:hypothetical protein
MLQVELAPVDGLVMFTVNTTAFAGRIKAGALVAEEITTFAVVDDVLAM